MKHSNFKELDLFIFDGEEYRHASNEPEGIVVISTEPPHASRSISFSELEEMLRLPGFRYVPQGLARASAERDLDGFPEHFRDLPPDKQKVAFWRHPFVEELLCYFDTGLAKRNEVSVALVLPAIITAVETRFRQQLSGLRKRAGRIETSRTPPGAHTLLNWTRKYRKAGFNIMALVPCTHRCGDHRSWMEPGELAAFDQLIAEYASPLRPTIDQIHERAFNLYADFNRARREQGLEELRIPSRSTVYRAINRMDPYETYLQRYGVDAANKKFAIIEYGVQVLRPMERIEIDEWECDLMTLVSEASLLGQLTTAQVAVLEVTRLVACVAIDCATRCVVGLTLSRSASSEAALRTLEFATLDKTDIAISFGCRAGWHQGGRPETIAADMGAAFVSDDFKMGCAGLHARLINPPGGVAKLRSRIERLFGTFASHFVSRFRGRTHSNPEQRGDYDAEAEASLTDHDLLAALVAAHAPPSIADQPTALEAYIIERLDGRSNGRWIDGVQLDVVVHTAEVFGALATRGPQASWEGISADELREHGHIGATVLIQGPNAIKDFFGQHIGRGRYGNDYHHAFGRAFDPFYFRKVQAAYQPIRAILAEYVGENFRFTHQEKVFGIKTRGLPPTTLRSLCTQNDIGLKITAQVLMAQHGIRAGASDEVDPSLIAELAPKLKDLINAQDAARYLGVSVYLLRWLIADGLLVPDYRFNDRMVGFRPTTLAAFLDQWAGPERPRHVRGKTAKIQLATVARANRTRTSQLLLAARDAGVTFIRDRRRRGLAALCVADRDIAPLLEAAK